MKFTPDTVIKRDEITRYYANGRDFIDDELIERQLEAARNPDPARVRDILAKSLAIQTLEPAETALLLELPTG